MTLEFFDNDSLVQLDWVTHDPVSNKIEVQPSEQEFDNYDGFPMSVQIKATLNSDATMINDEPTIPIFFSNLCRLSSIVPVTIGPFTIALSDQEATTFELP